MNARCQGDVLHPREYGRTACVFACSMDCSPRSRYFLRKSIEVSNTLYQLGNNSSFERAWTWAMSIHPRSELYTQACATCGRGEEYPLGRFDVSLEGGAR